MSERDDDGKYPVMGKEDFEFEQRKAEMVMGIPPGSIVAETHILCRNHIHDGVNVAYEEGMIVVSCRACKRTVCNVEVAEVARSQGKDMRH